MGWTRREFLIGSSALGAGFVRSPRRAAAQGQPAPATEFRSLRGGAGIFVGQGGTIGWLVSPGGVVVVDAQFPQTAKVCLDGLKERSRNGRIACLFNTHHHGDHTSGNGVFRPVVQRIVAHARVPELQKATAPAGTEASQVYADTTFTDRWSVQIGSETVTAAHYGPAHTAGDSIVAFQQVNVVHLGDLVFNRRIPYLDRPAGCRVAAWIALLEKIAREYPTDTVYVFGHAKPGFPVTGTREDLLIQRDFLSALLEHVRHEIAAGKTREAIVKTAAPLPGFPDHGPLNERALNGAYEELTLAHS